MPVEYSPPKDAKVSSQQEKSYKEFVEKNKAEIKKIEREFPNTSKAAIKDMLFYIWVHEQLQGGSSKAVFSKLRSLLRRFTKVGWARYLSTFKATASRFLRILGK